MRILLTLAVVVLISSSAFAEVITKDVDYKDGDLTLRGTIAYDDATTGKKPGILLFPEWWGNNTYIKKRAAEIATQGYVVFVADMYGNGKVTTKTAEAQELSEPLYNNRTTMKKRAHAALSVLKKQPNVDKKNLAAIGFCMGGTVALELARAGTPLKGVAAFHAGLNFPDIVKKGKVSAKVLVLNGAADPMVPFVDRQKFIEEMQNSGADLQFVEYGSAQHAFTNPSANTYAIKGVAYNSKAEKRSFKELQTFFAEIFSQQ